MTMPGRSGGRSNRSRLARPSETGPDGDPFERAREICLELLKIRPRTRVELATALRRRDLADEVVVDVLDRYTEVGIIDDEAFARAWVSSRHHSRGLARPALAGELRRKGVASEAVREALNDLDETTERVTARLLVERRLRAERRTDMAALVRRLVGMLARKGYPVGMAYQVVKEALAADAEAAPVAELIDADAVEAAACDTAAAEAAAPDEH